MKTNLSSQMTDRAETSTQTEIAMTGAGINMTEAVIAMAGAGTVMTGAETVTQGVEIAMTGTESNTETEIKETKAEIDMIIAETETLADTKTEEVIKEMKETSLPQAVTGILKAMKEDHRKKEDLTDTEMKEDRRKKEDRTDTEMIAEVEYHQRNQRIFSQGRERAGPPTGNGKYLQ